GQMTVDAVGESEASSVDHATSEAGIEASGLDVVASWPDAGVDSPSEGGNDATSPDATADSPDTKSDTSPGATPGSADANADGAEGGDTCWNFGFIANVCPEILAYSASPPTVTVGADVHLTSLAHDDNNDPLTFQWSATQGTFTDANAANTTYRCATQGMAT